MKIFLPFFLLLFLVGCAEPLPEEKKDYVGLWKSNQTSLLITEDGRLEYVSNKGVAKTSVSMPIKAINESSITAGFLVFTSKFELGGAPVSKDGLITLVVDGEELYKTDEFGRIPLASKVPSIDELRNLVNGDLLRLSRGIVENDFSEYISESSLQFQSQFNNQKMQDAYAIFIENELVVSKWMIGEFVLTTEPVIDNDGVLKVSGHYLTSPTSLKFTLSFVYSHPHWKSVGADISINGA
nr:hypothetical protein [Vibrio mimicus]